MNALVLLSGGTDSATCLAAACAQYGKENVSAMFVSYGQRHIKETASAKALAGYYGIELISIDLSPMFQFSGCSLLLGSNTPVPAESYSKQLEKESGGFVSTYVPFRNGLFLSAAASIALSKGCGVIYYGAHSGDSAENVYPDCSEKFNNAMNTAVYEGSGHMLRIEAPFIGMTKAEVIKTGISLNVPYELTWSCYNGQDKACGRCGTCLYRLNAFKENGIPDPIEFEN